MRGTSGGRGRGGSWAWWLGGPVVAEGRLGSALGQGRVQAAVEGRVR